MRKIFKILCLIILFNNLEIIKAEENSLIIHYKILNCYYDDIELKIKRDKLSEVEKFNYKDEFGAILKMDIEFSETVDISVYDRATERKIDSFQIDFNIGNEIWKVENSEEVSYELPKEYDSDILQDETEESKKNVTMYYKRFANDYENLEVEINDELYEIYLDGNFGIVNLELYEDEIYNFKILKNGNVDDFFEGKINTNLILEDEIFLVQNKEVVEYDDEKFENEKFIESAYLEESGDVYVQLYTPVKVEDNLTQNFSITEIGGEELNIKYVEPKNILINDYCDFFRIVTTDISFGKKYYVNKLGFDGISLSKKLVYDSDELNAIYKKFQNLGFSMNYNSIEFNLFYPNAEKVVLNVYEENELIENYDFDTFENDLWTWKISFDEEENFRGKSYNYSVFINGEEYLIEEPFSKVLDSFGHNLIFKYDDFHTDKNSVDYKENLLGIYKMDINNFVKFEEDEVMVSSNLDKTISETIEENNTNISANEDTEKARDKSIENVSVEYFEYDEGYLADRENEEENEKNEEVVEVFSNNPALPKGVELMETEEIINDFKISEINTDNLNFDLNYEFFYFDYGENNEIIRLESNINKIKKFINDMHKNNKKVIFNYNLDFDTIQYLCDEYYYSDEYVNTDREIAKKSIFEDIEFLIDMYGIDGLTFDLNYFDENFLGEIENEFKDFMAIGTNGLENNSELGNYRIYDFDLNEINNDLNKNIYKINSIDNLDFQVYLTILNNAIPFFEKIEITLETKDKINLLLKNKELIDNISKKNMDILEEGENYKIYKILNNTDEFDYYTFILNFDDKEKFITLPTKNNIVLIDDEGSYEGIEYENKNLILNPKSLYLMKSLDVKIDYKFYFFKYFLLPFFIFIFLIFSLRIVRKKRKIKIFYK